MDLFFGGIIDHLTYFRACHPTHFHRYSFISLLIFIAQVIALLDYEHLLKPEVRDDVLKLFPVDAVERALDLQRAGIKPGAYSDSQGSCRLLLGCFAYT